MKTFDLSQLKLFLKSKENYIVTSNDGGKITLKELGIQREKNIKILKKNNISPIFPIVSTALVINNRQSSALPRRDKFISENPEINTLEKLKILLDELPPRDFLKKYFDIKSKLQDASENPKYRLLKNLCEGFLEYKKINNCKSDIEALIHWADNIDIENKVSLKVDLIAKIKGVGLATIQNLKLTLSYDIIKGDRRVLRNLKKMGIDAKVEELSYISKQLGVSEVYLDTFLFEYKG